MQHLEKCSALWAEASQREKGSEGKVPGKGTKAEEDGVTAEERKGKEKRPKDRRADPKEAKKAKALFKETVTIAATTDTVQRIVQSRDISRV